jgi:hypothetical protein
MSFARIPLAWQDHANQWLQALIDESACGKDSSKCQYRHNMEFSSIASRTVGAVSAGEDRRLDQNFLERLTETSEMSPF